MLLGMHFELDSAASEQPEPELALAGPGKRCDSEAVALAPVDGAGAVEVVAAASAAFVVPAVVLAVELVVAPVVAPVVVAPVVAPVVFALAVVIGMLDFAGFG
jgi:hypothetical protein